MNHKTFSTWLPVFPGFYYTAFDESDNWIECELVSEQDFRERYPELAAVPWHRIQEDFWDCCDFEESYKAVAKACCDALPRMLPDIVKAVEFEELRRPREYNFRNDAINCKITVDLAALREYLDINVNDLKHYLAARYTSRDGFASSYPSSVEGWLDATDCYWNLDGHYCGALLQFIAELEIADPDEEMREKANVSEAFSNSVKINTAPLLGR